MILQWQEVLVVLCMGIAGGIVLRIIVRGGMLNDSAFGYLVEAAICAMATAVMVSYSLNILLEGSSRGGG